MNTATKISISVQHSLLASNHQLQLSSLLLLLLMACRYEQIFGTTSPIFHLCYFLYNYTVNNYYHMFK
jgi:hypothetical protein